MEGGAVGHNFERHFQQYFSYIMATSFSGGRSWSTQREPRTMVSFITCGCELSAPFFSSPGQRPCELLPSLGVKHQKSNQIKSSIGNTYAAIGKYYT
jgi:hypothetical protein